MAGFLQGRERATGVGSINPTEPGLFLDSELAGLNFLETDMDSLMWQAAVILFVLGWGVICLPNRNV